jgi:hypothetical protein
MSENTLESPVSLKRDEYNKDPQLGSSTEGAYPQVTLSCAEVLQLPEYGLITFRFKRGAIVARSASRSEKASASTSIELCDLCGFKEAEPDEVPEKEEKSAIDKLFEQAQEEQPEAE